METPRMRGSEELVRLDRILHEDGIWWRGEGREAGIEVGDNVARGPWWCVRTGELSIENARELLMWSAERAYNGGGKVWPSERRVLTGMMLTMVKGASIRLLSFHACAEI